MLADDEGGRQAAEALRSLIGQIVLTSGEKRGGIHAELHGELFGILEFANSERKQRVGDVMMKAVAGPATNDSITPTSFARGSFVLATAFGTSNVTGTWNWKSTYEAGEVVAIPFLRRFWAKRARRLRLRACSA